MDAVFFLDKDSRANFFRSLAQTVGCTYLCLWSYVPLLNDCLISIDGWYNDDSNQPSSSTGPSLAYRLFNAYRQTQHNINTGFVPGLSFKENIPYLELNDLDLLRRTANVSQQQFYQGARIKSAAFLSCRSGEIEIGMSASTLPLVNLKMEIINWLQQSQLQELISPQADQNWPSSSSSSLLSLGSPDSSSLLFNVSSSTSYVPEFLKDAQFEQAILVQPTSTPVMPLNNLQTMEAYNRLRIQNLNPESDNAAITRAMLAVISSPSSSSSCHQPQQTTAYGSHVSHNKTGAFKDYTPALSQTIPFQANPARQNMLKRSISMMREIDLSWRQGLEQGIPPTSSQLHHKLSERKRREKLNESFLELRSLLPPGSKKDKASVLSNTLEYLSNLKTEVLELKKKNQLLEARTSKTSHVMRGPGEELDQTAGSSNQNIDVVQIIRTSESTSEEQEINLRVTVNGDCNMEDLIINILRFLKVVNEVSLVWMNADTELLQNQVIFRLRIKGDDWDEAAFKEAVTRIVADVPK